MIKSPGFIAFLEIDEALFVDLNEITVAYGVTNYRIEPIGQRLYIDRVLAPIGISHKGWKYANVYHLSQKRYAQIYKSLQRIKAF